MIQVMQRQAMRRQKTHKTLMMDSQRSLSVMSYNCKHFKDTGLAYFKEISKISDFIMLQEHCLYKNQFPDF